MLGKTNVGGGADLNFKVVRGTTEPSNPKENAIWVNTSTDIHAWDFSAARPYLVSKNKNLNCYPYFNSGTVSSNGVTLKDNGDGSITVNGTASAWAGFRCSHYTDGGEAYMIHLPSGTYTVSGGTENAYIDVYYYDAQGVSANLTVYAEPVTFTTTSNGCCRMAVGVKGGATASNETCRPQLEKGSAATSFVKGDATGQVWIQTGLSSEVPFNALKKNGITVCPIEAKQYSGGAWVKRTAQSYQGGAWVEWWQGELYKSGRQYERLTGGWKIVNASAGVGALKNDHIYLGYSGSSGRDAAAYTNNKIDFSGYKTLKAEVNILNLGDTYYGFYLGVSNNKTSGDFEGFAAYTKSRTLGRTTVSFDLSSYQGLYYAALNGSVANAEVYKVWME